MLNDEDAGPKTVVKCLKCVKQVYTLANINIQRLALQKQQKLQKLILPASHWLCVNVLLN